MPKYIEDIKRRTVVDLSEEQYAAMAAYVRGDCSASAAATSINLDRQRFVNLVFTLLPQWHREGKIQL